ncbi:protein JINGUBANG-like [Nymphaea colorata]|nr:protein JINGUBANG-like [Nymphaea colorata]
MRQKKHSSTADITNRSSGEVRNLCHGCLRWHDCSPSFSEHWRPIGVRNPLLSSDIGAIKSIVLSDTKIFTAHQDGKIRVWEQNRRQHLRQAAAIPTMTNFDVISAIAIRGGLLYSTSWDRTLKVWRLSDFRCLESVRAHDDAISALAVSADGTAYTGSADVTIKVWTRSTGANSQHSLVATLEMHRPAVNALALSSDGSVLYSGSSDRSVLVWEKEGGAGRMAVTSTLRGHSQAVLCVANALELLASGSADDTIRIWRRGINNQYSTVAVLEGHERPVKSLAIAPSECTSGLVLIYSGSLDGEIKAWRVTQP